MRAIERVYLGARVYATQRCHSITVLAFLSIYLPRFHNLSLSLNQSAIEWAQGMMCQSSSEKERRDVHWIYHAEMDCDCCYMLARFIG